MYILYHVIVLSAINCYFSKPYLINRPTYMERAIASITSNAVQVEINKQKCRAGSCDSKHGGNICHALWNRACHRMTRNKMIYIEFTAPNEGDVALVYLKPDDFSLDNKENLTMYTVYLRAATKPTTVWVWEEIFVWCQRLGGTVWILNSMGHLWLKGYI